MLKGKRRLKILKRGTGFILLLLLLPLINAFYQNETHPQIEASASQVEQAFIQHLDKIQVQGSGTVVKILPDDLHGSRHQKFIIKINDTLTVLISHNIDLAPRIDSLRPGTDITFFGEYIWNTKGGLLHWTHHDPAKHHPDGWLKYQGRVYQ